MADLDEQFVDVDFTKDERFVFGDLGRNPSKLMCAAADDEVPLIPESQWRDEAEKLEAAGGGLDKLVVNIFDQGQEGSCVGNSTTQQHQVMQAVQFGKQNVVKLSAISLYKRIGTSPNSGAMIDDALEEMSLRGELPLDTAENRQRFGSMVMPPRGFHTPMPVGWQDVAKQFRADERLIIESQEALFSCLFRGFPVVVGRAGHSILYLRPKWDGKKWLVKYVNSWSEQWGEGFGEFKGGFGYDSASLFRESAQWAFAVRSIVVPSWLSP